MKVKINKGIAKGEIYAPPSKSYAHRLLICSSLASGESVIEGISDSVDMKATLECIMAGGASVKKDGDRVTITGGAPKEGVREYNCYESGSTLRFFIPISLIHGGECRFFGTERLMSRGLEVYEEIFKAQGIEWEKTDTSLTVRGKLKGGEFNARGDISSQFIMGLLFALPLLDVDSVINITTRLESSAYIDITIECLEKFGIKIERKDNSFFIKGKQHYKPSYQRAEGDLSNSAFLDAFNLLGGEVSVLALNDKTLQGDRAYKEYFKLLEDGAPTLDISSCPDLGPILFAMAGIKNGATITGTRRLKIKESDRAEAMATELRKIGCRVQVLDNSVIIEPSPCVAEYQEFDCHNDHRIVMALSVLSTAIGGVLCGCEAVSKSYPNFFNDIRSLGIDVEVLDEDN